MFEEIKGLQAYLVFHDSVEIKASGTSMSPEIREGDTVLVVKPELPKVGDIVVFPYDEDRLIMHRIIKNIANAYWCKGDNSLRIEMIHRSKILGTVKEINGKPVNVVTEDFILSSAKIGKLFIHYKYNREKLLQSNEYIRYSKKYLETES